MQLYIRKFWILKQPETLNDNDYIQGTPLSVIVICASCYSELYIYSLQNIDGAHSGTNWTEMCGSHPFS